MVNADDTTGGGSGSTSGGTTTTDTRLGIPAWIWNPRDKILGIIVAWIVAGVLTVIAEINRAIGRIFEIFASIPRIITQALVDAFGSVGASILDVQTSLLDVVQALAVSAGPFGPLLVGLAVAAVAAVLRVVLAEVAEVILFWR